MQKILITGANGQLGSELFKLQNNYPNWNFVFTDLPETDICNYQQIEELVIAEKITVIVNCAAYTAVDKAESDTEIALKVNAEGPQVLAKVAMALAINLIHISTDFVFDGKTFLPYKEQDQTAPINIYGHTKYEGEKLVLTANPNSIILRTSWLYSAFGNNFVKTMRRLGNDREELNVISDQIGTPTWANNLATVILQIIGDQESFKTKKGIFHYSNEGVASWYDFAFEIMSLSHLNCKVKPIPTTDYPTPAQRPNFSVMDKTKIKETFNITIPHWKESLKNCILELENNKI